MNRTDLELPNVKQLFPREKSNVLNQPKDEDDKNLGGEDLGGSQGLPQPHCPVPCC